MKLVPARNPLLFAPLGADPRPLPPRCDDETGRTYGVGVLYGVSRLGDASGQDGVSQINVVGERAEGAAALAR